MTTRINVYDHSSGLRDTVEIQATPAVVAERLRQAIGEPQFDISDDDEFAIHARVDVEPIRVHISGFPASMVAGAWNEILGGLQRRAMA